METSDAEELLSRVEALDEARAAYYAHRSRCARCRKSSCAEGRRRFERWCALCRNARHGRLGLEGSAALRLPRDRPERHDGQPQAHGLEVARNARD